MMRMVAGIGALNLPARFAQARTRIVLHAAVYGPFAKSQPHRESLFTALERASFEELDVIALDGIETWTASFMEALRFGSTHEEQTDVISESTAFLKELQTAFPDKVRIHPQKTIPCQPILIVDDTIIFGQYAHCSLHAADGFWGITEADIAKLLAWATEGDIPSTASSEEIGLFRLVSECFHAMKGGQQ